MKLWFTGNVTWNTEISRRNEFVFKRSVVKRYGEYGQSKVHVVGTPALTLGSGRVLPSGPSGQEVGID